MKKAIVDFSMRQNGIRGQKPALKHVDAAELFGDSNEIMIRQPRGWYVLRRYGDGTLDLAEEERVAAPENVANGERSLIYGLNATGPRASGGFCAK